MTLSSALTPSSTVFGSIGLLSQSVEEQEQDQERSRFQDVIIAKARAVVGAVTLPPKAWRKGGYSRMCIWRVDLLLSDDL